MRSLVIVRNTVSHDARVLRTAATLRREGLDPLVVGVMSTLERTPRSQVAGVDVLRLDPRSPMARVRMRVRRGGSQGSAAGPATAAAAPSHIPQPLVSLHRLLTTLDFYRLGIRVVRRERPALVHCNDFNTMWIGVAARLMGVKVVYDTHELWADRNGRREPRWWVLLWEMLFVHAAHAVVTTSPAYADVLGRRYRIARPVVVRNVPGAVPRVPASSEDGRIVYVGGLMPGRGLEPAIEALVLAEDVRLELVGPGRPEYRSQLHALADAHGVADRLTVRDAVAPGEVAGVLAGASAGLALIEPICLSYRLTLPNKLFEYLLAGVPVIASRLPAIEQVVRETGAGVLADPGDPADVARAMAEARARTDELRAHADAAADRYDADAEAATLAGVYREALAA